MVGLALILICTVIPFIPVNHWFVKSFEIFRVQILLAGIVIVALFVAFFRDPGVTEMGMVLLASICLAYQFYKILPYFPVYPKQVQDCNAPDRAGISILCANVLQTNENKDGFKSLVVQHMPDVLLTIETDSNWESVLETLSVDYPYRIKVPKDNLYGMHLYSRLPLMDQEVLYLVDTDYPSIRANVRIRNEVQLTIFCLHPPPPSPTEKRTSTLRDGELIVAGKKIREMTGPLVVCGDLNDVAWSPVSRVFLKLTNLLDPRIGRGLYSTFSANSIFVRAPIDHLFHTSHFCVREIKKLPKFGSDHFAMLYRLSWSDYNSDSGVESNEMTSQDRAKVKRVIGRLQSED